MRGFYSESQAITAAIKAMDRAPVLGHDQWPVLDRLVVHQRSKGRDVPKLSRFTEKVLAGKVPEVYRKSS